MEPISWLMLMTGLIIGLVLKAWDDARHIRSLRHDVAEAQNRLYASWKDGNVIPTAEQITPAEMAEVDHPPLHASLEAIIGEWDSQEVQDDLRRAFQAAVDSGFTANQVYERYIAGHYQGRPAGPM